MGAYIAHPAVTKQPCHSLESCFLARCMKPRQWINLSHQSYENTLHVGIYCIPSSLHPLSSASLSALQRSSMISVFRLGSTVHLQQPHLRVCQCFDLSAAPQVYTKTCTVWPSTRRTNNFIHLRSLSTFLFSLCSFVLLTGDKHQKKVITWSWAKWAIADNDENHSNSLITGSSSPVA